MRILAPAILRLLKSLLKTLLALVLLATAAILGYGMWYTRTPIALQQVPLEVEIPRGASLRLVTNSLQKAGVSIHRREFELLVRAFGRERDLKAGNYLLTRQPTPLELLDKLTRGDVTQAEVR